MVEHLYRSCCCRLQSYATQDATTDLHAHVYYQVPAVEWLWAQDSVLNVFTARLKVHFVLLDSGDSRAMQNISIHRSGLVCSQCYCLPREECTPREINKHKPIAQAGKLAQLASLARTARLRSHPGRVGYLASLASIGATYSQQ